ncbi:hypothetical protein PL8927_760267 [Planktothrix serta PCC 8927]|uniref:Uncharacterized protein n=1 Tax=Planktothrix serta PCC 8927 TaxID=671068 RepID=A0A7Z9BX01_9CYAN|nr:hypothetical protein [Planktothrix serta]VXD23080.1 hypothetical protein PL8927_760267 [Planktothrix serta PCC 8927]
MYKQQKDIEITINIAITLLRDRNLKNLIILKNFLTFIPNPNHIKEVLTKAVQEVVNSCPETTHWLLQHPHCLESEVKVKDVIHQEISNKFLSLGLTLEEFSFDSKGYLVLPDSLKQAFLKCSEFSYPNYDINLILYLLHSP